VKQHLPRVGTLLVSDVVKAILPPNRRREGRSSGRIFTGIECLDQFFGGLEATHVLIVAARKGVGKTSFAINAASHAATVYGLPALLCVFDTSLEDYGQRLLAAQARVDIANIISGDLSASELTALADAATALSHAPMTIFSGEHVSLSHLSRAVSEWRVRYGDSPGVLLVDTLQFLEAETNNVQANAAAIMGALRDMARKHRLLILATSLVKPGPLESISIDEVQDHAHIVELADAVVLLSGATEQMNMEIAKPARLGDDTSFPVFFKSAWARFFDEAPVCV
jgi:replicative DNA helicase